MDAEHLPSIARHVARLLVEGRYDDLESASKGVRLSAKELRAVMDEIDAALVLPPEHTWEELDTIAIRNRPGAFSVQFDLWTSRGRSDWTVELTLYSEKGKPVIEVDNIHVL